MINVSVKVKDNETVDRALKRFKKKYERANIKNEVRERKNFEKPNITRKREKQRAVYRQKMFVEENY